MTKMTKMTQGCGSFTHAIGAAVVQSGDGVRSMSADSEPPTRGEIVKPGGVSPRNMRKSMRILHFREPRRGDIGGRIVAPQRLPGDAAKCSYVRQLGPRGLQPLEQRSFTHRIVADLVDPSDEVRSTYDVSRF